MNPVSTTITCSRSSRLVELYPGMRFNAVLLTELDVPAFAGVVGQFAADVARGLAHAEGHRDNLAMFEAFFALHGYAFPLTKQIANVAKRGFPALPSAVLALMALEAETGVLLGVQDLDRIDRFLMLDAVLERDEFVGMRGRAIVCPSGEIVVRDALGVVASVFQGPDQRTSVNAESSNLVFYVFDADPSLGSKHELATQRVAGLVTSSVGTTRVLRAG